MPPPPSNLTSITLTSDTGDSIGEGEKYSYSNVDSQITIVADGAHLTISIQGDESWTGNFQLPDSYSELQQGSFSDLERYSFHDPAVGGLSWHGEGRSCNTLTGWIIINSVTYDGSTLSEIDLQFEQHCEGGAPALHGEIYWNNADKTTPPGPVVPPPENLWEPADGVTPASGNYVYLESQPGDFIGAGGNYLYTEADSVFSLNAAQNRLSVSVISNEQWSGDFQGMHTLSRLKVGYYGDLQGYPYHNPVKGGLSWYGDGRGCSAKTGWFVVDSVTYDGSTLTSIDLRFEQHCDAGAPALRGEIHWNVNDATSPPGPVVPPPAGLWEPADGTTPVTGNYVYLEFQPGDYPGAGESYLYTPTDSFFTTYSIGAYLDISIDGDEIWLGKFQGMISLSRLEVGYYGDLQGFPQHNPAMGGLSWNTEGWPCGNSTGWFVVDDVTYDGATLTAIELRFEQTCEDGVSVLHGEIHWDANDTTGPPGPVVPPPAGLWEPAPGVTPTTGNYVYLESEPGEYVGAGGTYLYTLADSLITSNAVDARLDVSIHGDEVWDGHFQAMYTLKRLEVGYYGELRQYPAHNPVRGGMEWYGDGRSCGSLSGWFVVDSVTYEGATLTAIDLRFEQRCLGDVGDVPALHGKIHWEVNDTTRPPGPVVPPPAGLWAPAPGVTPASGNYVYLESQPGEFVGAGKSYLYTEANSDFWVNGARNRLSVLIDGDEYWDGRFRGMDTIGRLKVGYYGNLQGYPLHNPVKGGLVWHGDGRSCNRLNGWFVVDSVTYDGTRVTAVALRFEQRCEGLAPALHGEIHWSRQ